MTKPHILYPSTSVNPIVFSENLVNLIPRLLWFVIACCQKKPRHFLFTEASLLQKRREKNSLGMRQMVHLSQKENRI